MGIKNLTKFIKENNKAAIVSSNFATFAFTKVAIDTPMLMYRYKHMNVKQKFFNPNGWLWSFIYFIHLMRKNDIHPVFVFEGSFPVEKQGTRDERKKDREDVRNKTKSLEESLCSYSQFPDKIPEDLLEVWNKIIKKHNLPQESPFDLEFVTDCVDQRHRYDVSITKKDYEKLKILLKIMGTPFIQAPMEAESFCSFLEKEQIVSGVLSNDSDVLAYGCQKLITEISEDGLTYIDNGILQKMLNFDSRQFLDFCIMCGTDYNKNIFKIGTCKSYQLIKTHNNIEAVGKFLDPDGSRRTIEILNHERIREIFTTFGHSCVSDEELQNLKEKATWSSLPNFDLLCKFGMKISMAIDFDSIKDGFRCNVFWQDETGPQNEKDIQEDEDNEGTDEFPIF